MNFDEHIDRNVYPTMKWSKAFLAEHFGNEEAIPMSVADMDLKAPPSVIEQLQERLTHGIFGYEYKPESYLECHINSDKPTFKCRGWGLSSISGFLRVPHGHQK